MVNKKVRRRDVEQRKYAAAMKDRQLTAPRRYGQWRTRADGSKYVHYVPAFLFKRYPAGYYPEGDSALKQQPTVDEG